MYNLGFINMRVFYDGGLTGSAPQNSATANMDQRELNFAQLEIKTDEDLMAYHFSQRLRRNSVGSILK